MPPLKFTGLVAGSFVLGQLLFLILPSPAISEIGPIQLRWYSMLFAGSFIVGIWLTRKMFLHADRDPLEVDQLFMYVIIATVVGARLGHVLFYDPSFYFRYPFQILAVWNGGLASHGAAIGILLALYLFANKKRDMSFLWLADRVVVVVAIAGAFIRTGNFMNSEIIGEPTEMAWGIVFQRLDMLPRHPTMLYEALLCIVVFAILWKVYKNYSNNPPEGSLFGLFLTILFSGRFLLEFTKMEQAAFAADWIFNMGQWLSVPLIIGGIWLIVKKVDWKETPQVNA
ncbi:prolipoprotein diacylglyceryl transferase [Aliifodinibius halophilus]|uniref:Phosphatidylglycerol--prolipoprotein diacylglyceryl transferase n=2 Tax=Fodinibius halophilus TaxID=1736908 RepID=A0A6M1T7U4_9BACT|nr:prolipoprotein diacylglyceryl transferase [Fodinibius halophilus]